MFSRSSSDRRGPGEGGGGVEGGEGNRVGSSEGGEGDSGLVGDESGKKTTGWTGERVAGLVSGLLGDGGEGPEDEQGAAESGNEGLRRSEGEETGDA